MIVFYARPMITLHVMEFTQRPRCCCGSLNGISEPVVSTVRLITGLREAEPSHLVRTPNTQVFGRSAVTRYMPHARLSKRQGRRSDRLQQGKAWSSAISTCASATARSMRSANSLTLPNGQFVKTPNYLPRDDLLQAAAPMWARGITLRNVYLLTLQRVPLGPQNAFTQMRQHAAG